MDGGVDPDTLLEWLQTGAGDERDLQLMALEQLCMLLLMSDNIDRCFENCPPRAFLPALGRIFLDETAPENILEVTARAITYYLDVSNECTRRITQVEGAVKAICNRLVAAEMSDRTSKDLAEQCVKLLEHICQREATAVHEAGGLQSMLHLVRQNDQHLHRDTMHSAMNVITRLCSKVDPKDESLLGCGSDLGALLSHDDATISECALRCFAALIDRFVRKSLDPAEFAAPSGLVERLLDALVPDSRMGALSDDDDGRGLSDDTTTTTAMTAQPRSSAFVSVVLSLLSNLCRGSALLTSKITGSPKLILALKSVLSGRDERCVMDCLRLADLIIVLLCEGRGFLPKFIAPISPTTATIGPAANNVTSSDGSSMMNRTHRQLIETVRQHDTDALVNIIENGTVDVNFVDDVGQTLLNWCAAFGTNEMVAFLCERGADVNKGQRSSSLHYAACFGRPEIVKILLRHGANPDLHDEESRTALEKARERQEDGHLEVVRILETPGDYIGDASAHVDHAGSVDSASEAQRDEVKADEAGNGDAAAAYLDHALAKQVLRQLIPIFCYIYKNSLNGSIRRSTLSLVRKCVAHLTSSDLIEWTGLCAASENFNTSTENDSDFVGNLMSVLVAVFDYDDGAEDVEGKELALKIMKDLLMKDADFWLEHLVRLGVYEKVEALVNRSVVAEQNLDEDFAGSGFVNSDQTSREVTPIPHGGPFENRSVSTTPSLSLRSADMESRASGIASRQSVIEHQIERAQMLNIPVELYAGDSSGDIANASPTLDRPDAAEDNTNSAASSAQALEVGGLTELEHERGDKVVEKMLKLSKATSTLPMRILYTWNNWNLIHSDDALYIWSDSVILELSDGSNGWLRFLMDGHLSTMYSSGNAELCSDEMDSRVEFIGKFRRARACAIASNEPLFSQVPSSCIVRSGNWCLDVEALSGGVDAVGDIMAPTDKNAQLIATNIECGGTLNNRRVVFAPNSSGFVFISFINGKNVSKTFNAQITLGLSTGASTPNGRHAINAQRRRVSELARDLWENYLKEAKTRPRDALVAMQNHAANIALLTEVLLHMEAADKSDLQIDDKIEELCSVLQRVKFALNDERLLSTFELSISGVVSALLALLEAAYEKKSKSLAKCFKAVFFEPKDFARLVRRVVQVLEHAEHFPQQLYDAPGGSPFGLQLLTRRFHLRMEQMQNGTKRHLHDRTDHTMKVEPLATVGALRQYIYSMVVRNWFDYDRAELDFVKRIKAYKASNDVLEFVYESDFDTNGLMWYLGTNGGTLNEWTNPALAKIVNVNCSDDGALPFSRSFEILSRDVKPLNCHTSNSSDANFTIDLGVWIYPTKYTLRHAQENGTPSALRSWFLQGSRDSFVWDVLSAHSDECALNESGATATWTLDDAVESGEQCYHENFRTRLRQRRGPYRYVRISQNGRNASGTSYTLSMSGFEIYGIVVDAIDTPLKPAELTTSKASNEQLKSSVSSSSSGVMSLIKKSSQDQSQTSSSLKDKSSSTESSRSSTITQRSSNVATIRQTIATRKEQRQLRTGCNSASTNSKLRMFRTHRNRPPPPGGNSAAHFADRDAPSATIPSASVLRIGARVVPGPDSPLCQEIVGTVVGVGRNGWIDIQWDDGSANTYRFGHDGKFEIDLQNETNAKSPMQSSILSGTPRDKSSVAKPPLPAALKSTMRQFNENSMRGAFTNLSAIADEDVNENNDSVENDNLTAETASISAPISQKSMSATNLFDEKPRKQSIVGSKQAAASAESLQHQTLSLENLLARARLHADRILEVVGDEQSSPAVCDSRNFGSEDGCHQIADNSAETSIAASSVAGGSQPVLSLGEPSIDAPTLLFTSTSFANTMADEAEEEMERDKLTELPSYAFLKRGSAYQGLSSHERHSTKCVSEPNLTQSSNGAPKSESSRRRQSNLMSSFSTRHNDDINGGSLAKGEKSGSNSNFANENSAAAMDVLADEDCVDRFLNSSEFCQRLSAFASSPSKAADNPTASSTTISARQEGKIDNASTASDEIDRHFLDDFVENAILREFMFPNESNENATEVNERNLCVSADGEAPSAGINRKDVIIPTAHSQNSVANRGQQHLSSIRARLGTYADVLRGVMQQVMESGSGMIGASFDGDSADEIFDDEFLDAYIIENNCDNHASEFVSRNIYSEVESLASATAAIRQHLSSRDAEIADFDASSSGGASTSSSLGALMAAMTGLGASSQSSTGSQKLNWRQIFLGGGAGDSASQSGMGQYSSNAPAPTQGGQLRASAANRAAVAAQRRADRIWDDDYVLRRQFGALIPAFDPRPGRTNVNQTQDVELTKDAETRFVRRGSVVRQFLYKSPFADFDASRCLRLYLKRPAISGTEKSVVELSDTDATLFSYIQRLCANVDWSAMKAAASTQREAATTAAHSLSTAAAATATKAPPTSSADPQQRNRRIWEPTYTLVYAVDDDAAKAQNTDHDDGMMRAAAEENEFELPDDLAAALLVRPDSTPTTTTKKVFLDDAENVQANEAVRLIQLLGAIADERECGEGVDAHAFHSSKLTQKLQQCLSDAVLVAGGALPGWCARLVHSCSRIFSTDTRKMYLYATAFGTSRAIAWLQSRRDQIVEQNRISLPAGVASNLAGHRRENHYPEYRVGRLKHERIKVRRDETALFETATRVMNFHALRKAVLEIEYYDEEGTGLGPTLEFYALVAAEFQRKSLGMWLCDDDDENEIRLESAQLDLGEGTKPPGYYVRRANGLFPAYYPPASEKSARVAAYFRTLGIFLAKVLLDGRLVDIPLSREFLRILLALTVADESTLRLDGLLGLDDLERIQPLKAKFLRELQALAARRDAIRRDAQLSDNEKAARVEALRFADDTLATCRVEDLALTFALNPPSRIFDWNNAELCPMGSEINVTIDNLDVYVQKCVDFYLNLGIREQVVAFREGFDLVFPLKCLTSFNADEIQTMLFGEQWPEWTRDDLLRYTEPKLGYTRDSPVYLRFIDVLAAMNGAERKAFLQFATGCASLPPGGLANLHPRLTIVRKVDAQSTSSDATSNIVTVVGGATAPATGDGAYPSVNTCVHYLKLPEYSSTKILRERLLAATLEKGFHLN